MITRHECLYDAVRAADFGQAMHTSNAGLACRHITMRAGIADETVEACASLGNCTTSTPWPVTVSCQGSAVYVQDAAPPEGQLLEAINKDFGSVDKMKEQMNAQLAGIQVRHTFVPTKSLGSNIQHGARALACLMTDDAHGPLECIESA